MSLSIARTPNLQLRFAVGSRVECRFKDGWYHGTVIKHFYTQRTFEEGFCSPYQVQLDSGNKVFVPRDDDSVVRELVDFAPPGATIVIPGQDLPGGSQKCLSKACDYPAASHPAGIMS